MEKDAAEYEEVEKAAAKAAAKVHKKGQKRKTHEDIGTESSEDGAKDKKTRGQGKQKARAKLGKKEGQSQGRGGDPSGEKCRVTMEFRQGVSGYFADGKEEVQGHILPSILVLKGAYGMLSNIDDDHYFKETMVFIVGGIKITHKAEKSAGKLMHGLVELRKKEPELFEGLVILQQPSAWMDEILQS